jgi:BioD-like phosphotransacetylase family protein
MRILYVTSLQDNAGKTMLCASLGTRWLADGKKVGYFKLVGPNSGGPGDEDAAFMKHILNLDSPVEALVVPVGEGSVQRESARMAISTLAVGKDMVIAEGPAAGVSVDIAAGLGARFLAIHDCVSELSESLKTYLSLGPALAGLVLNKVPRNKLRAAVETYHAELAGQGTRLLGAVPEDRLLAAPSISDLADLLQSKILNNPEKSPDLIENVMLGTIGLETPAEYFSRKGSKAVIVRGDKGNIQMAALRASTRCLVLSGGGPVLAAVQKEADTRQVPIMSVDCDVNSILAAIENSITRIKFHHENKLVRTHELLDPNFNFRLVMDVLGPAS